MMAVKDGLLLTEGIAEKVQKRAATQVQLFSPRELVAAGPPPLVVVSGFRRKVEAGLTTWTSKRYFNPRLIASIPEHFGVLSDRWLVY